MSLHTLDATTSARWRAHPYIQRGHVVIWTPTLVLSCSLNMASVAYPASALTVDNVTGSPASVEAGMLVKFYSSTGAYKGSGRILRAMSPPVLYVHPLGRGDVELADNDFIEVYDTYPPYALVPYIGTDGTLYKNYDTTFAGQTSDFPPVAVVTVDRHAGLVDANGVLTVTFTAASYAVADGATITGHNYDLKDGIVVGGSPTSATVTAQFRAGQRWVLYTCTDSNGATAIRRIPIYAADGITYRFRDARISRRGMASLSTGWELSLELYDADLSDVDEHTLIIFVKDEWHGTYHGSLTGCTTGFFGWITSEELHMEPLWSDTVINAQGPLAILQQRPAFPQTVRRDDSPANWAEVKNLDWWKTVVYLLRFHSNILELVNLERPPFLDVYNYPLIRLDSEAGTLYDQIKFLADAVWSDFTCDHMGTLHIRRNPHLMVQGERLTHTPLVELTADDLVGDDQGPRMERSHWDNVAWIRADAIIASATLEAAARVITPGTTPGQGATVEDLNRRLVADISELQQRAGHYYAWRNAKRDGARVIRRGELTLAHTGDVLDPAWMEVITLTLPASSNRRGYTFNAARFVLTGIDCLMDHEAGIVLPRLMVEQECQGAAAEYVPPSTDDANSNDQPYEPPVEIDPNPEPGGGLTIEETVLYASDMLTVRKISGADFVAQNTAAWSIVFNVADYGASWRIWDFQLDKLRPKTTAQVVISDGTNTRIYGTTNLDGSPPTWSQLYTIALATTRALLFGTHQFDGTWFLLLQYTNAKAHLLYTYDNWSNATIVSDAGSAASGSMFGMEVSGNALNQSSGVVVVGAVKSSDYGHTFPTNFGQFGDFYPPNTAMMPWIGNESEQKIYLAGGSSSSSEAYVQRTTNGGIGWTNITPSYDYGAGPKPFGGGRRNARIVRILHAYTPDPQQLALIGAVSQDRVGVGIPQRLFVSADGGDTWQMRYEFSGYNAHQLGGWPYDANVLFVSCSDRLLYTTDGGQTFTRHEWTGYSTGVWCVPVWVR